MTEVDLNTWEEFEVHVERLAQERAASKSASSNYISEYLFRGQSDSSFPLATTLERFTNNTLVTFEEYYKILLKTKPQVEAFTEASREKLPSLSEYMEQIGDEGLLYPGVFPAYEYFVYLRHHGFPSPLLDWTQSAYVATYFAFRDISSKATSASIFVYCEFTQGHKSGSSKSPKIVSLGHNVRGHRRHFQQQNEYTICTIHVDGKHTYAPHSGVFDSNREDQDKLWKFNIPTSERHKILKRLERYNINAFSLFGSEESLMETLAIRDIFSRGR